MASSFSPFRTLLAFGCLFALACGAPESSGAPAAANALRSQCEDSFQVDAMRSGRAGVAWLLYACEGAGCNGQESFARGMQHAISFEVTAGPESAVHVESEQPSVARVADFASTYDPCAEKVRGWAILEALRNGETRLSVRDAKGELDSIAVSVADPARIRFRLTRANAFAFENSPATLEANPGEAWLLLPESFDARGELLIGAPALTWHVGDPQVAELRTDVTPEAGSQAAPSVSGAALLKAQKQGETAIRASSENGTEARLLVRVLPASPP